MASSFAADNVEAQVEPRALPRGLHLHLDAFSGIAGDMTVAALVDAGVPEQVVRDAIATMKIPGLSVEFCQRRSHSVVSKAFMVSLAEDGGPGPAQDDHEHSPLHERHEHHDQHEHRDYQEIRKLLSSAELSPETRQLAEEMFFRLARAEAKIHGVDLDRVTFHEVGAYDSIADIVGIAAAIAYLAPSSVSISPPALGSGTVETAHGILPVPAPATVELLMGIPTTPGGETELTTPTGAALLATLVKSFDPPPVMKIVSQGFGSGDRTLADRPNVLRVVLGMPLSEGEPHD